MGREHNSCVLGYAVAAMRRPFALLIVVFFAVFVVELSPHLVHHLFDDDQEQAAQSDCPFATIAERQHPDAPVAVDLERGADHAVTVRQAGEAPVRSHSVAVGGARAPPSASS